MPASSHPRATPRPAREHRDAAQTAVENGDCQARIDALEATVDAFRRATTVVDDPDIATAATREEAESAIDDLVCAHLARARNCRSVGNWSAEAGDAEDALDHFGDACDCFERALELAERYPGRRRRHRRRTRAPPGEVRRGRSLGERLERAGLIWIHSR